MPNCANCNTPLDSSDKECSVCGTPVPDVTSFDNPIGRAQNDTIHQLLLNANLLKIRGNLDGAIAECINALRIDPDNVTAHSLIGDIYRSQGKADEALRWYRLALDISPNSMRDRARVEELSQEDPQIVPASADWKFSPLALWTLLAVFVAVIVGTLWIHVRRVTYHDQAYTRPSAEISIDQASSAEKTPSAALSRRDITAPAAVKPASVVEHTDREATVIGKMNASSVLVSASLRVTGIAVDPRDNSATITFTPHSTGGLPSAQTLVHSSLVVAKEAFQVDSLLPRVTVRAEYMLADNGELHPQIAFVGEVKREALENQNIEVLHYGDQVNAFDNPWWAPNLEAK